MAAPSKKQRTIWLDGESLTAAQLYSLEDSTVIVDVTEQAWKRVRDGRAVVDKIVSGGNKVYGINTGTTLALRL